MPWESKARRPNPPGWHKTRLAVIQRAMGQCEFTPPATASPGNPQRCGFPGTDVDHIVNVAQGGSHDLANLQLLCPWHHKQKTQQEARAARTPRSERHPGEKHPGILPPTTSPDQAEG